MRLSIITASTAALLMSSTALFAQEAQTNGPSNLDNVFVDVDGSAVQVPVALAAEACGLDEAGLQQLALTRLNEAGMDAASIPGLMTADAGMGTTTGLDASGGMSDTDATSMDTASADATATTGDAAGGMASDTADASTTLEQSNQPAQVDDSSTMAEANSPASVGDAASTDSSTDMATADAAGTAGTDLSGVGNVESTAADTNVSNAQGTADPTTATPGEQYLALAVCQIDVTRASELGIPNITNETVTE